MSKPTGYTTWANTTGFTWWVCECCTQHGGVELVQRVVLCRECGQKCSCDGCVEDTNE